MYTVQIELTEPIPQKWSAAIEHLTIFDLTKAVLKKLDPGGQDLSVKPYRIDHLWRIVLGTAIIGEIKNLTHRQPPPPAKPKAKKRKPSAPRIRPRRYSPKKK